jgi:NTP pyrophosphatase (non-canonical NTP hydrolase)
MIDAFKKINDDLNKIHKGLLKSETVLVDEGNGHRYIKTIRTDLTEKKMKKKNPEPITDKREKSLTDSEIMDLHFLWSVDEMGKRFYENEKKKGFDVKDRNDGEAIALIHSEVSEMLEALRKDPKAKDEKCPKFTNLEVEAADVFIRLVGFCQRKGLKLGLAVLAKHQYNTTRPMKHGKKF